MIRSTLLIAGLAAAVSLNATPLYDWKFSDPAGTALNEATNEGLLAGQWDGSFEDSATNGIGEFIIRRTPGSTANAYVPIVPTRGNRFPDQVWLLLELGGWQFGGTLTTETLRIGIVDTPHEERPSVLAQIRFGRNDSGQVYVLGESFGSEDMETLPLVDFSETQIDPVTFVLHIDKAKNRFEIFSQSGDDLVRRIGGGATSPEREARYLRFAASGHFRATGEFVAVTRIAVLTEDPFAR